MNRITFKKQWVEANCKYICDCGNVMYRKNRDWFTMNPFNKKSFQECQQEMFEKLTRKKRNCNQCGSEIYPV